MKINVFKMQILMGERGLTIKKLAELSGVSRQTISCIISGKGCTPQVAYKIATALDSRQSLYINSNRLFRCSYLRFIHIPTPYLAGTSHHLTHQYLT